MILPWTHFETKNVSKFKSTYDSTTRVTPRHLWPLCGSRHSWQKSASQKKNQSQESPAWEFENVSFALKIGWSDQLWAERGRAEVQSNQYKVDCLLLNSPEKKLSKRSASCCFYRFVLKVNIRAGRRSLVFKVRKLKRSMSHWWKGWFLSVKKYRGWRRRVQIVYEDYIKFLKNDCNDGGQCSGLSLVRGHKQRNILNCGFTL